MLLCFSCKFFFFYIRKIYFFRLRGQLPFDSKSVDNILRKTIIGKVDLFDLHWSNVSDDGKYLKKYIIFSKEETCFLNC